MNIITIPNGYLNENTYIVSGNSTDCILVDPGFDYPLIKSKILETKLSPKYILITHGHFDHIHSVDKIVSDFDIKDIFIHELDADFPFDPVKNASYWHTSFVMNTHKIKTFHNMDILKLLNFEIICVGLQGHTPGSTFFVFEKEKVMFTGDTLIKEDLGITHLYGGSHDKIIKTAFEITKMSKEYTIYPGHGTFSSIEYELNNNKYLRTAWQQYKQKI